MAKKKKKSTAAKGGNNTSKAVNKAVSQSPAPPTSNATATAAPQPETQAGFDLLAFFKESREELAKVVWPSRQQLIGESVTVILMVTLVATTIYLVDNLFSWLSDTVFL